eukprot:CAMPEP_0201285724 /NCGR_PEP_ID=MMETSP1317-20130820/113740_1 /ASSEMBLY_ACC=CAM_ASM_000770 /TAXON_ID=187299 /ORGANISM="Undescribed Undescribed, Strain Undescribed" /LENGTH=43 /DNA_ID= /DNA_START= /DNA_END= /DNA_ORIENTATION=
MAPPNLLEDPEDHKDHFEPNPKEAPIEKVESDTENPLEEAQEE